jgi:hypothetical protein
MGMRVKVPRELTPEQKKRIKGLIYLTKTLPAEAVRMLEEMLAKEDSATKVTRRHRAADPLKGE